MGFFKTASAEIIDSYSGPDTHKRIAALKSFDEWDNYIAKDDFLYVRVRAISSRVNKNHDGWPADELKEAYRSFIGKPLFVDHHNSDPSRARGIVVDAKLHVEGDPGRYSSLDPYYANAPKNHLPPTWIELLLEVDAKAFPRLAKAVINKDIDGVSMGANVEYTVCSHCSNVAHDPTDFCSHIREKGSYHDYTLPNGTKTSRRSYEDCHRVGFFELSFVFDPADETALIRDLKHAKMASIAVDVNSEGSTKTAFSDVFGGLDFNGYVKQIAKEAWDKTIVKPAPDPESNAWNAVQTAIRRAGFPTEAAEVANDMRAEYEREHDVIQQIPEEGRGYDEPYRFHPEMEPVSPSLREMMTDVPNNAASPNLSHKTADNAPPQIDLTTVPQRVNTLRDEKPCALCGNTLESGKCPTCGYEEKPEGLDNPDLTKANPELQNTIESTPLPDDGAQPPPGGAPQNVGPPGGLPANGMGQGGSMNRQPMGSSKFGTLYNDGVDPWTQVQQWFQDPNLEPLLDDIAQGNRMVIQEFLDDAGLPFTRENVNQLIMLAEQQMPGQRENKFINSPMDGETPGQLDNMVMNASFGTIYRDPTLLTNEKTAADNNLSGGRINSIEKPLLPLSRTVSDRPKNQRTVSDSTKPVQSKDTTNIMPENKTADSNGAAALTGQEPMARVDVTDIGGISGVDGREPKGSDEYHNRLIHQDVTTVGGDVLNDDAESVDVAGELKQELGEPTSTWTDGRGDSAGQHNPVTNKGLDMYNSSFDGIQHTALLLTGDPLDGIKSVDVAAELKQEVGGPTATWGSDDFHITDPVTDEHFPTDGVSDASKAVHHDSEKAPLEELQSGESNPTGDPARHHDSEKQPLEELQGGGVKSHVEVRSHIIKAMKVAEVEQALGITPAEMKFDRAAELETEAPEQLDARLDTYARVRKAGLRKPQEQRQASVPSVPSFAPATIHEANTFFDGERQPFDEEATSIFT